MSFLNIISTFTKFFYKLLQFGLHADQARDITLKFLQSGVKTSTTDLAIKSITGKRGCPLACGVSSILGARLVSFPRSDIFQRGKDQLRQLHPYTWGFFKNG